MAGKRVKSATIDHRDQNKQNNAQKRPWSLRDVRKFDKGCTSPIRVSARSDERQAKVTTTSTAPSRC
jgi:hypothetical protein